MWYVCDGECYVVYHECDETTSCMRSVCPDNHVLGYVLCFGGLCERCVLNFDNVDLSVVSALFTLRRFVFIPLMLICSMVRFLSVL